MMNSFGVDSMSFIGPTTLAGWQDVNIPQWLEKASGLPGFIEIDMAAAALGEQLYGHGTNLSDYYYLYFGLGLGGRPPNRGHGKVRRMGNLALQVHGPLVIKGQARKAHAKLVLRFVFDEHGAEVYGRDAGDALFFVHIHAQVHHAFCVCGLPHAQFGVVAQVRHGEVYVKVVIKPQRVLVHDSLRHGHKTVFGVGQLLYF